jgi:hypothetical protein
MLSLARHFGIFIIIMNFMAISTGKSAKADYLSFLEKHTLPDYDPRHFCTLDSDLKAQGESRSRFKKDQDAVSNFLALYTIVSDHLAHQRAEDEKEQQNQIKEEANEVLSKSLDSNQSIKAFDPFSCLHIDSFVLYNCSIAPHVIKHKGNEAVTSVDKTAHSSDQSFASVIDAIQSFGRSPSFSGSRRDLPQGSHLFCSTKGECEFYDNWLNTDSSNPALLSYEDTKFLEWSFRNLNVWVKDYLLSSLSNFFSPITWYKNICEAAEKSVLRIIISGAIACFKERESPRGITEVFSTTCIYEFLKEIVYHAAYIVSPVIHWVAKILPSPSVEYDFEWIGDETCEGDEGFALLNSHNIYVDYRAFYNSITTDDHFVANGVKLLFKLYVKIPKGLKCLVSLFNTWTHYLSHRGNDPQFRKNFHNAQWDLIEFFIGPMIKYTQDGEFF